MCIICGPGAMFENAKNFGKCKVCQPNQQGLSNPSLVPVCVCTCEERRQEPSEPSLAEPSGTDTEESVCFSDVSGREEKMEKRVELVGAQGINMYI